jgi:hypothetical protein
MTRRIVLIPFLTSNSFESIISTRGGNIFPETEQNEENSAKQLAEVYAHKKRIEQYPDSPKRQAVLDELAPVYDMMKDTLRKATAARAKATKPGWRKIAATDIYCSDTMGLNRALGELTEADDTLYIRGHCCAGGSTLQSADHKVDVVVKDVIDLMAPGLRKSFSGKIKIFACESGIGAGTRESFASRFKKAIVHKGWINAQVYGYDHTVNTYIIRDDGHKSIVGDGVTPAERARSHRVPV